MFELGKSNIIINKNNYYKIDFWKLRSIIIVVIFMFDFMIIFKKMLIKINKLTKGICFQKKYIQLFNVDI